jgi:hypothetical protein
VIDHREQRLVAAQVDRRLLLELQPDILEERIVGQDGDGVVDEPPKHTPAGRLLGSKHGPALRDQPERP